MLDADAVRETQKKRCFFSLVWIVLLFVLVWPLAYTLVGFYVLLLPFEEVDTIGPVVKECVAFLEKSVCV
jgi:hypothetical protein